MKKILEVKDLKIEFKTKKGILEAVSNVSYTLHENEVLGIVGESGCGKSISAMSLMGLLPPSAIVSASDMTFEGRDLRKLSNNQLSKIRGKDISIIFQEPMTSLNPLMKVGPQIVEMLVLHEGLSKNEAKTKALDMMEKVGLQHVESLFNAYTHALSGGMIQRVMIAMAMICNPSILIADEPTTALDVTIQAQILALMKTLNKSRRTAIIFISHDLGVIKEACDQVLVMYLGYVVEKGHVDQLLKTPSHPYTIGLLQSIPNPKKRQERLYAIEGKVPNIHERPKGCPFSTRCYKATEKCQEALPDFIEVADGHFVRCFYPECEIEKG